MIIIPSNKTGDLIHYQKLTSCSVILTSQTRANTIKNLVEAQPTGVEVFFIDYSHWNISFLNFQKFN